MLKELQTRLIKSRSVRNQHFQTLKKELDDLKNGMDWLCDAIENGILPSDFAQERSRKIQASRQALLAEMAG